MAEEQAPIEPAPEPVVEQPSPAAVGFLDESAGSKSAMRLMSVITAASGILIMLLVAIISMFKTINTDVAMQAGMTLLSFAFGGKILHKLSEKK